MALAIPSSAPSLLLELVSVDGRDLRKSIKQQSHIKLSPIEFEAVKQALAS
jgi:hypothetical protein